MCLGEEWIDFHRPSVGGARGLGPPGADQQHAQVGLGRRQARIQLEGPAVGRFRRRVLPSGLMKIAEVGVDLRIVRRQRQGTVVELFRLSPLAPGRAEHREVREHLDRLLLVEGLVIEAFRLRQVARAVSGQGFAKDMGPYRHGLRDRGADVEISLNTSASFAARPGKTRNWRRAAKAGRSMPLHNPAPVSSMISVHCRTMAGPCQDLARPLRYQRRARKPAGGALFAGGNDKERRRCLCRSIPTSARWSRYRTST